MPLYDYECTECGVRQERFCKMSDRPEELNCIRCKGKAKRILAHGHGGIQCDSANDVIWLKSAEDVIKPAHEKPWESRKDYNDCLKRNNLQPAG